jgi:hypothetical protein
MVVVRYSQAPVGWWQDGKGLMQPPGSFLSPSLRVGQDDVAAANGSSAAASQRGWFRKWAAGVTRRQP